MNFAVRFTLIALAAILAPNLRAQEATDPKPEKVEHPTSALPTVDVPSFEETRPDPGFVDLFNGKDLSGWIDRKSVV